MTTAHTFGNNEIKLHWQEDYVTEGLNKQQTAESHGVVRGFELAPLAIPSADQFLLAPDSVKQDGVVCVRNSDNRVITLIMPIGSPGITINMAALGVPNGEYWVCAVADYSIGASTTVTIEIYTTAQLAAAAGKVVVLGWVKWDGVTLLTTDPAAGTPTLGPSDCTSVTLGPGVNPDAMREVARLTESKGRMPWLKLIRLGRADEYWDAKAPGILPPFSPSDWHLINLFNAAITGLIVDDTDPYDGDLHFTLNLASDTSGSPNAGFIHRTVTHVRPGDLLRLSFQYKVPVLIPGGYLIQFGVAFLDVNGALVSTPGVGSAFILDGAGAAMATYEERHHMFQVPAGKNIAFAIPVLSITHNDVTGAGFDFYFDELDLERLPKGSPDAEGNLVEPEPGDRVMSPIRSSALQLFGFEPLGVPVTNLNLGQWEFQVVYGGSGGCRLDLRRKAPAPSAGPPYPHLRIGTLHGIEFEGDVPVGSGITRRHALYQSNIPRAYALIAYDGANYNLSLTGSFGFVSGVLAQPGGPGTVRLVFIADEDGNDWVGGDDYVVVFGTKEVYPFPGPYNIVYPIVYAKNGPAPRSFDVALLSGSLAAAVPQDFNDPGAELYVAVFRRGL